jgi:hypothetical protein
MRRAISGEGRLLMKEIRIYQLPQDRDLIMRYLSTLKVARDKLEPSCSLSEGIYANKLGQCKVVVYYDRDEYERAATI